MKKLDLHALNFLARMSAVPGIIALDLSGNNLKLSYIKFVPPNKKEVVSLVNHAVTGVNDADIAKLINTALTALNVKPLRVYDVLPSQLLITKNIEVPSINPQEIKEIISLQAGRHTPYSREEIIVDYIDIGTYKRNYTKVLLVMVARNVVKRHFEIASKAGFPLERVLFAPEATARFMLKHIKGDNAELPSSIINVDETTSDFFVMFKHKVIFVRAIAMGAQQLASEKEKYQVKFLEEAKKSLEAYQAENIEKTPQSMVITGAVSELPEFEIMLGDALQLPVKVASYLKGLQIQGSASVVATQATRLSFLNVIASALHSDEVKVDLVPEEVKLKKAFEARGRDMVKTGILVLTLLIILLFTMVAKIYFKSAYLKKINHEFTSVHEQAVKLENDSAKISLIKNYVFSRGYSLEVLTELYTISPLDLALHDIRFDDQGKFSVKGTAESMSVVFSFVDSMEKSKYFKEVKTKYTTKRKEGKKDVTDFEIGCLLGR
ncbi:MAG: pilus assembly protein PilM [Candidatus Omnitrophota bacterium]|jgi:Tfp pilus assembly PilM family ATPase